jgi:tetratricopeptide (TPR) repeat protein
MTGGGLGQPGGVTLAAEPAPLAGVRVFLSYRRNDVAAFVRLIRFALIAAGVRESDIFQDVDQPPGVDFHDEIEHGVLECDAVLAIIGADWQPTQWVEKEIGLALERDVPVFPILVQRTSPPRPDELPDALAALSRLQGLPLADEAHVERDLEPLVRRLVEIAKRPVFKARPRNDHFVGREAELAAIERAVAERGRVAVVGLPGYGKTQLALEYAHRHRDRYRIVWEVPAEDRTAAETSLGALARILRVPQRADQPAVNAIQDALGDTSPWLLVFDNADTPDEIAHLLQGASAHVIMTSRRRRGWDDVAAATVQLDALEADDALALLRRRARDEPEALLVELAEHLGRMPLALEQASAYMRRRAMPVTSYIKLVRDRPDVIGVEAAPDYPLSALATWRLTFDAVAEDAAQTAPGAVDLLNLSALLDPDDINFDLMARCADVVPDPLASVVRDELARADAIGLLADYSLVRWGTAGGVSIHRSVQHFVRELLGADEQRRWASRALSLVLAAFPVDPTDVSAWKACQLLLPHVNAVVGHASRLGTDPVPRARLLGRLGEFLRSNAQFAAARAAFDDAIGMLAPADPDAATVRRHLGDLCRDLGDFDEAQRNLEIAREVHEARLGGDSRDVGLDRLSVGRVLADLGALEEARAEFERALEIHRHESHADFRIVAEELFSLFSVLVRTGNLLGAKARLMETIAVYQAAGQETHPEAVFYGFVYEQLFGGERDKHQTSRLEQIIDVSEQHYGEEHPDVADWNQLLGDHLLREGNLEAAEERYATAFDIDLKAYGANHWRVARDHLRLFVVHAAADVMDRARHHLQEALRAFESLPSYGPSVAAGPAVPLFVLGKFEDAFDSLTPVPAAYNAFDRISLLIREETGEPPSALYAAALECLGSELHEAGPDGYAMAREALQRALSIFRDAYGEDHPRLAPCLNRLGGLAVDAVGPSGDASGNDYALEAYLWALRVLDSTDNPNLVELITTLTGLHPLVLAREERAAGGGSPAPLPSGLTSSAILARVEEIAQSAVGPRPLLRVADALSAARKHEDAIAVYDRVRAMLTETYGPTDPDVALTQARKAEALHQLGDYTAARACFEDALGSLAPDAAFVPDASIGLAITLAALGEVAAAERQLEDGLAVYATQIELEEQREAEIRAGVWLRLGDSAAAAGHAEDAARLYQRGRERAPAGEARLVARLGGLAGAAGNIAGAVEHLRESADSVRASGGADPFWSVVMNATPAARVGENRETLDEAFRHLRADDALQQGIATFRPRLIGARPSDWLVKESITLLAPDGQANVIASSEPLDPEIGLDQYASIQGDLLRGEFPGYEEASFKQVTCLGGRRGWLRQFSWSPPDGVSVTQLQLYYAEDSRGYTATATTPSSRFADVELELRQMLLAVDLLPPAAGGGDASLR